MATDLEFIEYVIEQLREILDVRYRKMFGEYMIYASDRPVMLVCDNNCYVKILPETQEIIPDNEKGCPYEGAKPHFIVDIDDRD